MISSTREKPAEEQQPGHGGKDVCLRNQTSPTCGHREWSGRHKPEIGTISPLRNGTLPDCVFGFCGGKIFSPKL